MPRPHGYWYPPGLIYDLAFRRMFKGLRERVAKVVESEGLYPWLDVCSGTGDQLRGGTRGPSTGRGMLESGLAIGLDRHWGFVRYAAAKAPGVPFVCGDAARLPFKDGSARAVSISFGLHDKNPDQRRGIIQEARRALGTGGRLIAVDFERPWNAKSRVGALFVWAIERLAGGEHYRNGREFLRNGGLRAFLSASGLVEVDRREIEAGSLSIVIARGAI